MHGALANTDTSPRRVTFGSQRLTLSCALWNAADDRRPLAVLVHGALDQARSWDWTARRLSDRYRVAAPDLRGHGLSDWVSDGDYAIMDMVYDLAQLIDHLGRDRITLIGHSLGGNIVLRYAGLFPERVEKLVCIEGLGPSPKMLADRADQAPDARIRQWIENRRARAGKEPRVMADADAAKERMARAHPKLSPEQVAHLTQTGVRAMEGGGVRWAYDKGVIAPTGSDISHEDFKFLIAKIACPVWLVYGAQSWASNPEKDGRIDFFKSAAMLKVTEFQDAGHWLHHEQFELFMERLEDFLSGGRDDA